MSFLTALAIASCVLAELLLSSPSVKMIIALRAPSGELANALLQAKVIESIKAVEPERFLGFACGFVTSNTKADRASAFSIAARSSSTLSVADCLITGESAKEMIDARSRPGLTNPLTNIPAVDLLSGRIRFCERLVSIMTATEVREIGRAH